MASIDIRTIDDEDITVIVFGNGESEDYDIASLIQYHADGHPDMLFLNNRTVAKADVPNLIKALEKSLEIWK